jgi:hypothetical protein
MEELRREIVDIHAHSAAIIGKGKGRSQIQEV